jgi:hypothetical protein
MMHGPEKSDLAIVAGKPANKVAPRRGAVRGGVSRSGVGGAKGGGQRECGLAKHALDAESGSRVTGAGLHAAIACRLDSRWEKLWGGATEVVAPSSSIRTDGGCPVVQVNDLSRSLAAFDPISTLVVDVEMSRMRESRTYGSARGACDETHVPTATASRVPRVSRRRGCGGMLTHPRCCAADRPTDMQCARAPGNRAIL